MQNLNQRLVRYVGLAVLFAAILVVQLFGIGVPSLWWDEASTVSAATRDLPALWQLLQSVDMVHAGYYFFMHFWFAAVGYTPFTLRLPSAVFVTLAAFGVYRVTRALFAGKPNREWLAAISAVLLAVLPQSTWASTEGRSSALNIALGTFTVLLFWRSLVHTDKSKNTDVKTALSTWWPFIVLFTLASYVFVFQLLLIPAFAAYLWIVKTTKSRWVSFAVASGASLVLSLPILISALLQRQQIDWIKPGNFLGEVVTRQYFHDNVYFAVAVAAIALVGLVVYQIRTFQKLESPSAGMRNAPFIGLMIVVVPTAVLLAYSVFVHPIYSARYGSFTIVGLVLVLVAAIASFPGRLLQALLVLALAGTSMFTYLEQRTVTAKDQDWSVVAAFLADKAQPGDGVLFLDQGERTPTVSRLAVAYPDAMKDLVDVSVAKSASDAGTLYPTRLAYGELRAKGNLDKVTRIWVIWEKAAEATEQGVASSALHNARFHPGPNIRSFAYERVQLWSGGTGR